MTNTHVKRSFMWCWRGLSTKDMLMITADDDVIIGHADAPLFRDRTSSAPLFSLVPTNIVTVNTDIRHRRYNRIHDWERRMRVQLTLSHGYYLSHGLLRFTWARPQFVVDRGIMNSRDHNVQVGWNTWYGMPQSKNGAIRKLCHIPQFGFQIGIPLK